MDKLIKLGQDMAELWSKYSAMYLNGVKNTLILALVATAIGLGVAVPATIGFNIFMGKLSQVDTLLVNFAGVFLNRVQRELNAHRPVQRTGATEM